MGQRQKVSDLTCVFLLAAFLVLPLPAARACWEGPTCDIDYDDCEEGSEEDPGGTIELYETDPANEKTLAVYLDVGHLGDFTLSAQYSGTGRISVWEYDGQTYTQLHLPFNWNNYELSQRYPGAGTYDLYVRGEALSGSAGDVKLVATYEYSGFDSDTITLTVGEAPQVAFTAPTETVVVPDQEDNTVHLAVNATDPDDRDAAAGVEFQVYKDEALLTTHAATRVGDPTIDESQLSGRWQLDGDATDLSGNDKHGAPQNVESDDWVEGRYKKAVSLDGTNQYVSVSDADVLDIGTGDFAISVWFKRLADTATDLRVLAKGASDSISGYSLYGNDTAITAAVAYNGTVVTSTADHSGVGKWTHVVVNVKRNDNMYLYVNGSLADSDGISGLGTYDLNNSLDLDIGRKVSGGGSKYWKGLIDDVRIYKRTLSESEISYLATSFSHQWTPGQTGRHIVKAVATDDSGRSATASKQLTVVAVKMSEETPARFPGLDLWLTADKEHLVDYDSEAPQHDDHVKKWTNRVADPASGAEYLEQTGNTNYAPKWVESVAQLNGRPVLRFDGALDHLKHDVGPDILSNSTVFLVYKLDSTGLEEYDSVFSTASDVSLGTVRFCIDIDDSDPPLIRLSTSANTSDIHTIRSATLADYRILCVSIAGTKLTCFSNGMPVKDSRPDFAQDGYVLGETEAKRFSWYCLAKRNQYNYYAPCDIAEVIVYRGPAGDYSEAVLNGAQRQAVELYLSRKYGIAISHPPSVALTAPTDRSAFKAGQTVTLKAAAHDPDGETLSPLASLEARWGFDTGSGTDAKDTSGHGRTATLAADPNTPAWLKVDESQYGGALGFADADAVTLPQAAFDAVTGGSARTITAWFKPDAGASNESPLLTYGSTAGGCNTFRIIARSDRVAVKVGNHIWGVDGLSLSGWNHVAVVFNGQNSDDVEIYLGGTAQAEDTISGSATQVNTGSASGQIGGTDFLGGVDDVRVYSEALNSEAIGKVKAHTSGRTACEFFAVHASGTDDLGAGTYNSETGLYERAWQNVKPGIYTLTARAIDNGIPVNIVVSEEVEARVYAADSAGDGDFDSDGLPDWWELACFDDLEQGSNDVDGDGYTNSQEYSNQTNPCSTDNTNAPALVGIWPPVGSTVPLPACNKPLVLSAAVKNAGDSANIELVDQFGNNLSDPNKLTFFGNGAELEIDLPRRCLVLDGSGDYVSLYSDVEIGTGDDFTLAAWVKLHGTVNDSDVILSGQIGSEQLTLDCYDGKLRLFGHPEARAAADKEIDAGKWVHVAIVRADGDFRIYYDAELQTETIGLTWSDPFELDTIGKYGSTEYLEGRMADVRIYTQALNSTQVHDVMSGYDVQASLSGRWKMDDGEGGTAADSSPNNNYGTLQGGASFQSEEEYLSGMTFKYVLTVKDELANEEDFTLFFRVDPTLPTVAPSVAGGRYFEDFQVALTASEDGATIYYSTDGVPPVIGAGNTQVYSPSSPISISKAQLGDAAVLQFFAVDEAGNRGPVEKAVYLFRDALIPVEDVAVEYRPASEYVVARVICSWSEWTHATVQKYNVYRAAGVLDRRIIEESRLGNHPPPEGLRIGSTTGLTYADNDGIVPGSTVWYGVTVVDSEGTESPISQIVPADLGTTKPVEDVDDSVARAAQWLASTQSEHGYWGQEPGLRIRATNAALKAMRICDTWTQDHPLAVQQGLMYLMGNLPDNNTDMATTTDTLQLFGRDTRGPHVRLHLRAYRDSQDTIQGWGAQERFLMDAMNTALAVRARQTCPDAVPGGLTTEPKANLQSSDLKSIDGSGEDNDGYGWAPNGLRSIFVSGMVYEVLWQVVDGDPDDISYQWVLDKQEDDPGGDHDGAFNRSLLDTAAVLLWVPIQGADRDDAKDYLVRRQLPDGSWGGDAFLTALCLEALKKETVDFKRARVSSYTTTEDGAGGKPTVYKVMDDGRTLKISGNAWKKIPFCYSVTANTVLEFYFMSTVQGQRQGIGFDNDNTFSPGTTFKLYGTEEWPGCITDYENEYSSSFPNWHHYVIDVGSEFTGDMVYMTFICDDDEDGAADCFFKNVKVYESP